ncbi:2607_t:CDS:2, partial [Paraglomus brasilianum]
MAEAINNGESSFSKTKNKGKAKQIEDNEIDDINQSDENLSAIQLREQ